MTHIDLISGGIAVHLNTESRPDQVNLVAPDGTVAEQRSVTAGQRIVEFSTITDDSSPGRFPYSSIPISPGTYTIVASGGDTTQEESIPLSHSIELTDVSIATDTQQGTTYPTGVIATIKNTGTLPFRVDTLTFKDRIPAAADGDYTPTASHKRLDVTDDSSVDEYMLSNKTGVLIDERDTTPTNQSVTYSSGRFKTISQSPFLYQSDPYGDAETPIKRQFCGQTVPFTLTIKAPHDATRRFTVTAKYGSSTTSIGGLAGSYYSCTPVQITKYTPA